MRLSDSGLRQRQTKALYPNHRLPPWLTEDATRDRSNRLLDAGWTHYFPAEWTTITRFDIHAFHTLPKRNAPFWLEKVPRPGGKNPAPNWCRSYELHAWFVANGAVLLNLT